VLVEGEVVGVGKVLIRIYYEVVGLVEVGVGLRLLVGIGLRNTFVL